MQYHRATNQDPFQPQNKENSFIYKGNCYSCLSLDFLQEIPGGESFQQKQSIKTHSVEMLNEVMVSTQVQRIQPKQPTTRVKSKFHNYQKHLIISLRRTIKLQKLMDGKFNEAAKDLWSQFCNSKFYNKSMLRVLFGEQIQDDQLNLKLFSKEGFSQIIKNHKVEQILEAQSQLRREVISFFDLNQVDLVLDNRKIKEQTKQLFGKYIMQFVGELKQERVHKRIPKMRKLKILQRRAQQ